MSGQIPRLLGAFLVLDSRTATPEFKVTAPLAPIPVTDLLWGLA